MNGLVRLLKPIGFIVLAAFLAVSQARSEGVSTPDDTARFLAGLEPSAGSPLAERAKDPAWKAYAADMDQAWASLDTRQFSKVRNWSTNNLRDPQPVLFYMFSGPDYLYANAFFPNASTYVLSGLELVGKIPDISSIPERQLPAEVGGVRRSLNTILRTTFFITSEMGRSLGGGRRLTGTLPVLYVFLARSGKTIQDVRLIGIDRDGKEQPAETEGLESNARGAKIVFSANGKTQTLYYIRTDLSNKGVGNSGFLKFCDNLGSGDALVKSASYLLHSGGFSMVRELLMKKSVAIVQDDTGVPFRYFNQDEWTLQPFGQYMRPLPVFRGNYQKQLSDFFQQAKAAPLNFIIGYRSRETSSGLLLAVRKKPEDTKSPIIKSSAAPATTAVSAQ